MKSAASDTSMFRKSKGDTQDNNSNTIEGIVTNLDGRLERET